MSRGRVRARQRRHRHDRRARSPIDAADTSALSDFAARERIDLTVVGPELPLDRGIADLFASRKQRLFGPSRAAAQLECSKAFAKAFMARHGIPTARYRTCDDRGERVRDGGLGRARQPGRRQGRRTRRRQGRRRCARSRRRPNRAIRAAMEERHFGDAGARVVLEECLEGPEVSFFAHLRRPARRAAHVGAGSQACLRRRRGAEYRWHGSVLAEPAASMRRCSDGSCVRSSTRWWRGCARKALEYRGFLYAGLMLTCDGPKVIEFNVRFGDPEAQVVIRRSTASWRRCLAAAADGALEAAPVPFRMEPHVGVVLAARGLSRAGDRRRAHTRARCRVGLDGVLVFHAGTARRGDDVVTAGGRVLTVVGRGPTYERRHRPRVRRRLGDQLRRDAVPPRHRAQGASDRVTAMLRGEF